MSPLKKYHPNKRIKIAAAAYFHLPDFCLSLDNVPPTLGFVSAFGFVSALALVSTFGLVSAFTFLSAFGFASALVLVSTFTFLSTLSAKLLSLPFSSSNLVESFVLFSFVILKPEVAFVSSDELLSNSKLVESFEELSLEILKLVFLLSSAEPLSRENPLSFFAMIRNF